MLIKEFKISGLQCDTPHCNYRDDSIQFEDYPSHINTTRCPVCNSVLLTQNDYNRCLSMYAFVDKINRIGHKLRWLNPMYYYRLITKKEAKEYNHHMRFEKRKD